MEGYASGIREIYSIHHKIISYSLLLRYDNCQQLCHHRSVHRHNSLVNSSFPKEVKERRRRAYNGALNDCINQIIINGIDITVQLVLTIIVRNADHMCIL